MDKKALAGLAKLRGDLTKSYGSAVSRKETVSYTYETFSTGSASLDVATGIGGLPLGRVVLYWGPEGAGKTTSAILAMIEAQKQFPNRIVGYIDMEQTFDWAWAEGLGLDTSEERFLHVFPDNSEDVADQAKMMLRSGLLSCVVVDSVGGMETKKAMDKDAEESDMGKNAQVITRMSKVLAIECRKQNATAIIISQVRANFAAMSNFDTFAGPKGMRHATSMNIKFSRTGTPPITETVGKEKVVIGLEFKGKIERSKVSIEGRSGTFFIFKKATEEYGPAGIDRADDLVSVVDEFRLVPKRGSWYDLPDGSEHNGRNALKAYLRETPAAFAQLRQMAIDTQKGNVLPNTEVEFVPDAEEASA